MKRKPVPTKRERKAVAPARPAPARAAAAAGPDHHHEHQHIHCIACGRHLDASQFESDPPTAVVVTCQHGSRFATCTGCREAGQALLDEHDRTNQPVRAASAWH